MKRKTYQCKSGDGDTLSLEYNIRTKRLLSITQTENGASYIYLDEGQIKRMIKQLSEIEKVLK